MKLEATRKCHEIDNSKKNKSAPRTPKFYVENTNLEKPWVAIIEKIHYVFGEYKLVSRQCAWVRDQ